MGCRTQRHAERLHLVMRLRAIFLVFAASLATGGLAAAALAANDKINERAFARFDSAHAQTFLDSNCTACHSDKLKTSGLSLENVGLSPIGPNAAIWEDVVTKLQAGEMPPPNAKKRPDPQESAQLVSWLVGSLDKYAAA